MGPFLERGFSFRATSRTGIKNWPISRTGYQFQGNLFLERGTNLESRVAHTHPKNTQAPPPPGGVEITVDQFTREAIFGTLKNRPLNAVPLNTGSTVSHSLK